MSERQYTRDHEWLLIENDIAVIGITDYAQEQLGDVVYVELPNPGDELIVGDQAAVVESVKAAGEINSPLSGVVESVNELLADTPETLNSDPNETGWLFKLRLSNSETEEFMDEDAYKAFIQAS